MSAYHFVTRWLTPVLRPVFSANHLCAMQKGEESLRLELLRRAAKTEAERMSIDAPPKPTFQYHIWKTIGDSYFVSRDKFVFYLSALLWKQVNSYLLYSLLAK